MSKFASDNKSGERWPDPVVDLLDRQVKARFAVWLAEAQAKKLHKTDIDADVLGYVQEALASSGDLVPLQVYLARVLWAVSFAEYGRDATVEGTNKLIEGVNQATDVLNQIARSIFPDVFNYPEAELSDMPFGKVLNLIQLWLPILQERLRKWEKRESRKGYRAPITCWIDEFLLRHPDAKNKDVWQTFQRRPLKGYKAVGEFRKEGAHITTTGRGGKAVVMGIDNFCNLVALRKRAIQEAADSLKYTV